MIKSEEERLKNEEGPLGYHKVDQSLDCASPKGQSERAARDYLKK